MEAVQGKNLYAIVNEDLLKFKDRIVEEQCDNCKQVRSFCYTRSLIDTKPGMHFLNDRYEDNSVLLFCGECPECEESHFAVFIPLNEGFEAIGYYPGIFSRIDELDSFDSVLSDEQRTNFVMAIRSSRLGMYAGSFVYFRRLIESLVEKILFDNKVELDNATDFKERLARAEQNVPLFPDDLTSIKGSFYRFISEGVHSWTDEQCAKQYPLAEYVIKRILDYYKQKKENEKMNAELRKAIGKMDNDKRS